MSNHAGLTIVALLAAFGVGCEMHHRVGASTSIQFGTVRGAEPVTLDSAVAQGALIGGTLGLITGSRNDSSVFNAARGAAVGGVATAAAEGGARTGMAYTVEFPGGGSSRIVSDQREIHVGDCVAIEQAGSSANIRRAAASYCDPASAAAVRSVDKEIRTAAADCEDAKQELRKAADQAALDLAARRVELLCDG
jgi:outer membrane lipoprotein SlyB